MAKKQNSFLKKIGIYFVGSLSSKLLNVILVPIYAFSVAAADLGDYDYVVTLSNILIPIAYITIWEGILKFLLSCEDKEKNKIIGSSVVFILFVSIILIPILYFVMSLFFLKHVNNLYSTFVMICYGMTAIWQYYCRGLNKNNVYVYSSVIGTIVNVALNILLICVFKMGFKALCISYIVSNFLIVLIIEFKVRAFSYIKRENIDKKIIQKLLMFSFPLMLNCISAWLIMGFSKYIINNWLGSTISGQYAFANKFCIIVTLFGSVINMAFIEESILQGKEGKVGDSFLKNVETIFCIFLQLLILILPVINLFYEMIGKTEYYDSKVYFPILLVYALFSVMSTNIGTIFHVVNKTKYAFFTTLIGAIISITISLLGLKYFGLMAVLIGQIMGVIVITILRYIFTCKYANNRLNLFKIALFILLYVMMAIVSYYCSIVKNIILFFCLSIGVLFCNRKMILSFIRKGKKTNA